MSAADDYGPEYNANARRFELSVKALDHLRVAAIPGAPWAPCVDKAIAAAEGARAGYSWRDDELWAEIHAHPQPTTGAVFEELSVPVAAVAAPLSAQAIAANYREKRTAAARRLAACLVESGKVVREDRAQLTAADAARLIIEGRWYGLDALTSVAKGRVDCAEPFAHTGLDRLAADPWDIDSRWLSWCLGEETTQ